MDSELISIISDEIKVTGEVLSCGVTELKAVGDPSGRVRCFVCGPPPMIDSVTSMLSDECAVPVEDIHYEKWW